MLVERTWHGDELETRMHRADGRAVVGMGNYAAAHMTDVAHEISGDLKRSTHAAKRDTLGEIDADPVTVQEGSSFFALEVGSWLPYACVENNRGGAHRFADIGWQAARPGFDGILVAAWAEEGLR